MGLETGTYISDLVASNPAGTDGQSQGDDHLRLLKSVLQACFPNASKAFRFPTDGAAVAGNQTVTFPDDQNKIYRIDATAANRTVTLPTPSGANAPGWAVIVMKSDSSVNYVTVAGTVNGSAGGFVLRRQFEAATFIWIDAISSWVALPHVPNFVTGTAMIFVQTAAPAGWTKQTTYNDRALRLVSGTASIGGNISFGNAFKSHTLTQANLPNVNLTAGAPTVGETVTVKANTAGDTSTSGGGARVTALALAGSQTVDFTTTSNHSHQVPLGGLADPIRLDVQYVDVIYATKD